MKAIQEILQNSRKVAIGGHVRPDGDCIGSCLGLFNYIREQYPDIEVRVYLESIPEVFSYLQGSDEISHDPSEDRDFDLFISLDASDKERLGEFSNYFDRADRTACIDHHITNQGFADLNHVPEGMSSTAETLFWLMDVDQISKAAAECLYTGIIHDTGVFKYSNTTRHTLRAAGELIAKGIDFTKIIDETFYQKTYVQNQMLGRALLESITFLHGTCIFSAVKKKDMDFYGVTSKDLDGIVEQMRSTVGVECAIFLYETDSHEYKVSLRSNTYLDVSKIASFYGGGGHIRAAGCTMGGNIYDVINNLSQQIEKQMVKRQEEQ